MIDKYCTRYEDGKLVKYEWKCPNICKCKKVGKMQYTKDCERNPTIKEEEIEI
jgi:hypothetical protein